MNVPALVQSGPPIDSAAQQDQTTDQRQPKTNIQTAGDQSQSGTATTIGDWDKCVCLGCGKVLAGFMRPRHTQKVHNGKDPGYRKI